MNTPNSTTLHIDPKLYDLTLEQIDNLALEFYGSALEVTNDSGDIVEVEFAKSDHINHSSLFFAILESTFRKHSAQ